jgi:Acetyltransferase (GNAT) family
MITIKEENFNVVEENKHLVQEHWDEIVKDKRDLDVNWEFFRNLENLKSLVTIVARENDEVIGYAVFVLQYHLHSRKVLTAHNDAVFVKKNKRFRAGALILKMSEEILNKRGATMIFWHVKPSVDFGKTLIKLGYNLHETIYIKHVGGD